MNPKAVFEKALTLNPGGEITITFPSKKEADSMRVSLYTVKRSRHNDNILISREGSTVKISKAAGEAVMIITNPGEESETSLQPTSFPSSQPEPSSSIAEILKEALEMKEKLGWSEETYQSFIKEALRNETP